MRAVAASPVDVAVVGAGVVGMAIAYGLSRLGKSVCVIDEGDLAFKAARGNFGLVWVQGKGARSAAYGSWTLGAAAAWPAFAADLRQHGGIDVDLAQPGGLTLCTTDEELQVRIALMERMRALSGPAFAFQVLSPAQTRERLPAAGCDIVGAVYCPQDGHVSPLKLLRALFSAHTTLGGRTLTGGAVETIAPRPGGGFDLNIGAGGGSVVADRVVLAAGLGNQALAGQLGLQAPVRPVRGQLLVTERVKPFLAYPTLHVRQTTEGTVQIGDSKEEAGFDDGTTLPELARIARRAVRCFPCLADVNVVRSWGALRVMSQDGLPLYQESNECPGAYLATCHSGITLAPQHAHAVARWVAGGTAPDVITDFSLSRFHVQTH